MAAAAGLNISAGGNGLLPIMSGGGFRGDWHRPDDSGPSSPRSSSSPVCSREEYNASPAAPISPPESDESGLDLTKKE